MAEVKQKVAHCLKRQRDWFGCLGVEILVCLDAGSGHWMDGWEDASVVLMLLLLWLLLLGLGML